MDDEGGSVPADSLIRYDLMVQEALRQVVRDSLTLAADEGLPGEHHFYITFSTTHPGVDMPDSLRAQYPDEMTIVLQHQFWQLKIEDETFIVTLSFSGVPHTLTIPYKAVSAFADPHVRFGLQFHLDDSGDQSESEGDAAQGNESGKEAPSEDGGAAGEAQGADGATDDEGSTTVVSLDTFRRKR